MARVPGWMIVESERWEAERDAHVIAFRLARFWWARPSFWIDLFRIRGLR